MKKVVLFASGSGSNVENIVGKLKGEDISFEKVYTNNSEAYVLERCERLGIASRIFSRIEYKNGELLKEIKNSFFCLF